MEKNRNIVSILLMGIGGLIFIIGLIVATKEGLSVFLTSFVIAMLFVGLGEMIRLMHNIHVQITPAPSEELKPSAEFANNDNEFYTLHPLNVQDQNRVYHYFKNEKKRNINIMATPFEKLIIVNIKGKYHVVQLAAGDPEIITDPELSSYTELLQWTKDRKGIQLL